MKFVCDRCQTKYSIADDRVRGKVLKVKCKTCANLITVREARRPSSGGISTTAHAAGGPAAAHGQTAAASLDADDSGRTVLSPYADLPAEARAPVPSRRPTGPVAPLPPPPVPDEGVQWYMALDGQRTGPFSRKQLVDKIAPLPKHADVHVWNEKLGSWKPPTDVPAVAHDLAARRKGPAAPPPGAPRRPTPSPPPPPVAHAHAPAPVAHAAAPAGRRPTTGAMAAVGASAPKLPMPSHAHAPKAVDLFAPASPSRADDASSLLQTPAPHAHVHNGHGTNGLGASNGAGLESVTGRPAMQSSSDVLRLLNLPGAAPGAGGAPHAPHAPPAPPRLMSGAEAVGWSAPGAGQSARKNARFIFAFLGIIAVVCVVVTLSMSKKPKPMVPVAAPKATVTDPLAAVVEKAAEPSTPEPPSTAPVVSPLAPSPGKGKPTKLQHGHTPRGAAAVAPPPLQQGAPPPATPTPAPGDAASNRFRDGGPNRSISAGIANRPPPSQADISRVISNNRNGIKTCYQRALLRDSSLTHGKVTVKLTIGISGRVKHVAVDGPTQFRAVEPCLREVVSRWSFPQASDEYGTEFVYVFQGNE